MTSYALTHSTSCRRRRRARDGLEELRHRVYRTYMKTPQNNPDGYKRTAPRFAAANLHGRMLLVHGTIDDNVHAELQSSSLTSSSGQESRSK